MDWQTFLTIAHVIGVVLGAGGATFAEVLSLKALQDGIVDPSETELLKLTYRVLRVGLIILALSGFGYFILWRLTGNAHLIYDPRLLAKLTILVFALLGVIAWSAKKVPIWFGSAASLVSWYSMLILGIWRSLDASYITIMIAYFLAIPAGVVLLAGVRRMLGIKLPQKI